MKRIISTLSFDRNLRNAVFPASLRIEPSSCIEFSCIKLPQIVNLPESGKLLSSIAGIARFFPRLRRDVRISWPFPVM